MRNIGEVIDRIKAVIPEKVKVKPADLSVLSNIKFTDLPISLTELRHLLDEIKEDAGYTAPEMQGKNWHKLCVLLEGTLPIPPETDWQREVQAIIMAKK